MPVSEGVGVGERREFICCAFWLALLVAVFILASQSYRCLVGDIPGLYFKFRHYTAAAVVPIMLVYSVRVRYAVTCYTVWHMLQRVLAYTRIV